MTKPHLQLSSQPQNGSSPDSCLLHLLECCWWQKGRSFRQRLQGQTCQRQSQRTPLKVRDKVGLLIIVVVISGSSTSETVGSPNMAFQLFMGFSIGVSLGAVLTIPVGVRRSTMKKLGLSKPSPRQEFSRRVGLDWRAVILA